MNDKDRDIATQIWPQHMQPRAFMRQWENDPYAVRRTAALTWLGDRYICARPQNASRQKAKTV